MKSHAKNRISAPLSIALVSLGCAKNAVDLQNKAGALLKKGFVLSPDPDNADIVIVNTCSFIAAAREEAEAEILRALELKKLGNYKKVVVSGCYPQRYPEMKDRFPGVDSWDGVPEKWVEPGMPGFRLTGKAYAYLKIAEGCAHRCAYCAIPLIRGKYRSRPIKAIVKEASALLATGCRELNIVAQDPMLYGIDFPAKKRRPHLVKLLRELDKLEGDFWIRVLYSYPNEISAEFIEWMNSSPHAVKYIDVPLQHTVPEVLEKMNRGAAAEASRIAAEALRASIDGVTLRTTIMTGFPGETETRFAAMLRDLKRMQFDYTGVFSYSPEEGTPAMKLRPSASRKTAEERREKVIEEAEKIWAVKAQRMIGKTYRALVVAPRIARMASQAPDVDGVVLLKNNAKLRNVQPGDFANVRLVKSNGYDFEGVIA